MTLIGIAVVLLVAVIVFVYAESFLHDIKVLAQEGTDAARDQLSPPARRPLMCACGKQVLGYGACQVCGDHLTRQDSTCLRSVSETRGTNGSR